MKMEQKNEFINRIRNINSNDKPKFGQMNVYQMICHCADQFRMMYGELKGLRRQNVDVVKMKEMAMKSKTVPTVEGLDQIAGGGTKPTDLENDKKILIDYINKFHETEKDHKFHFHPFFGNIEKDKWERLVVYHLNHHLNQFGR